MKQPYKQGILDGMCGFYSIINALHYLKPNMNSKKSESVLMTMVKTKRDSFHSLYMHGMYFEILVNLVDRIMKQKDKHGFSNISHFACFEDEEFEDHYEYLSCLEEYVVPEKSVAIISIGHPWHHWTVTTKVDLKKEKLHLFDSYYDRKNLSFSDLSIKRKKDKFQLYTHETLIITKK
jgi:hypothetical protein